jgi:hypothetical protein
MPRHGCWLLPTWPQAFDWERAAIARVANHNQVHFYPEHPETGPHIHSIMLIAPQLVERFEAIRPRLSHLFQSLGPANCTLNTARLQTNTDLRRATFYSSKLLQRPPRSLRNIDLYTCCLKRRANPSTSKRNGSVSLRRHKKKRAVGSAESPLV